MSRILEICLTVLALVAVAAATVGARQELARAPAGTFPLQILDPIVTSGTAKTPAVATPAAGPEGR